LRFDQCLRLAKELVFVGRDGKEGSIANELLELMAEALDRFADQQAGGDLPDTRKYTIETTQPARQALYCSGQGMQWSDNPWRPQVERLLAMLAEDCGMIISRPGSLEGSEMANLLASHGYDLGE